MPVASPESTPDKTRVPRTDQGAGESVQYELRCVQALRGREGSAKAKWHNQGWEFVSESRGTLRTELTFRRVKPKTLGARLQGLADTFGRLQPGARRALITSCALILVVGVAGIVVGTQSGSDTSEQSASSPAGAPAPPAAAPASPADSTVTDTTVDDLFDRLNAGEAKVGEQFKVIGELVGSDLWTTGASGDFLVMLKTKQGSDLEVFIDQSKTNGWQDGTKVEMVLKVVQVTINGETLDGFLEAQSAKTIARA